MTFNRTKLVIITLVAICGCVFIGRGWLAANMSILEHDDAISLLTASAHMEDIAQVLYDETPPYMTPTPASTWQQMIQSEDALAFRQIAHDVAVYDRHAPLYFWVLHSWMLLFGSSILSVVVLNLVLDAVIAVMLFRLARRFVAVPYALVAVIIWLFSPISMYAMLSVRPYVLLTLGTVWYADSLYTTFSQPDEYQRRAWQSVSLVGAMVCLLLTHYSAFFILAAGGLAVLLRWWRDDLKRVGWLIAHGIGALGIVLLLHPYYVLPFTREGTTFEVTFPLALERVLIFSLSFFLDAPYHRGRFMVMRPLMVGLLVGVPLLLIGVQWWLRRSDAKTGIAWQSLSYIFTFLIVTYGSIAGMYLAGLTPLSYRYFDPAVPFAALLIVLLLTLPLLQRVRLFLAGGIVACMIVSGLLTTREATSFYWDVGADAKLPDGNELVIVNIGSKGDNIRQVTYQGHALQVIYNLQPGNDVIVGHTGALLDNPDRWLPVICDYDETLFLGFPNDDLFQMVRDAGYTLSDFPSYLYYTDTRRITAPDCAAD